MTEGHNDRNDLSRNDRSDSSCGSENQSASLVERPILGLGLTPRELSKQPKCFGRRKIGRLSRCGQTSTMSFSLNSSAKVVGGCGMAALLSWILFIKEKTPATLYPAGWDDLIACSELVSIDGSKRLSLSENHVLKVYDKAGTKKAESGTWSYREQSKQYSIVLADQSWNYVLVSPNGSDTCILASGNVEAADLRASWFSITAEYDDSREDDHGAR
jgi:hypothetical protein